jgi:hypothetical protein
MKLPISALAVAVAATALLVPSATATSASTAPIRPSSLRGSGMVLTSSSSKAIRPYGHSRDGQSNGSLDRVAGTVGRRTLQIKEGQTCYVKIRPTDDVSDDMQDSPVEIPCTSEMLARCHPAVFDAISRYEAAFDGMECFSQFWTVWEGDGGMNNDKWNLQCCGVEK